MVPHHPTVAEAAIGLLEPPAAPTHEEIAARAYAIYENQGRVPGHCQANWHQAEWALRVERQAAWRILEIAFSEKPATYFDSSTALDPDAAS
jgi:hypothetical protein